MGKKQYPAAPFQQIGSLIYLSLGTKLHKIRLDEAI